MIDRKAARWLISVAAFFLAGCHSSGRFIHVDSRNPYIMFDQRTAQSCWAGPAEKSTRGAASGEFGEGELTPEQSAELGIGPQVNSTVDNAAHLPFCKDLK